MKYKIILTIIVGYLLVGCAGADVMLLDPSRKFQPTENVLFLINEPDEEYEIIAIIEAIGSQYNNQSQIVRAAQKKAGKIGAHGIIPMTTESKEVSSEMLPNPVVGGPPIYIPGGTQMTMKFAAIRYIR